MYRILGVLHRELYYVVDSLLLVYCLYMGDFPTTTTMAQSQTC